MVIYAAATVASDGFLKCKLLPGSVIFEFGPSINHFKQLKSVSGLPISTPKSRESLLKRPPNKHKIMCSKAVKKYFDNFYEF
jgi:hypothetical protein